MLIWEECPPFSHRSGNYKQQIAEELARLGNAVPADVDMGYHLNYATAADRHLAMPRDTGIMVEMTRALLPLLQRPLNFLHMPVPKNRTDDAYFLPLKSLDLPAETDFYLSLIHHDDRAGDEARIRAASSALGSFGVSAECGWGRTKPDNVPDLIEAHRVAMARHPS